MIIRILRSFAHTEGGTCEIEFSINIFVQNRKEVSTYIGHTIKMGLRCVNIAKLISVATSSVGSDPILNFFWHWAKQYQVIVALGTFWSI